jgi:hypothetical protein
MVAIKIDNFQGKAPRTSPELLDNTKAQIANNLKMYSGDLLPYRIPRADFSVETPVKVESIFGIRNDLGAIKWMSWGTDVDVVLRSDIDDKTGDPQDRRFFYTGDGYPKQSWLELAVSGPEPYPSAHYRLGLPLPTQKPTTDVTGFTELETITAGRNNSSRARLRFSAPHNLRDGNIISVTGFLGGDSSLNTEGIEVVVRDDDEIFYFNRGEEIPFGANTDGRVNLAGGNTIRSYVYTWISPFGEESVPSEPSDDDYLLEGQTVTVQNLPSSGPGAEYLTAGIRLYRTVVTANGSDYFRLKTLFFPGTTATVARLGGVATVTTQEPHNLIVDDRFKLDGTTVDGGSFDTPITGSTVTEVVDRYTFRYANAGSDIGETADTGGTLYHDAAELPTDDPRFWGDGNYDFIDDFESRNLLFTLTSQFYDEPPDGMQGLVMGPNNIACGFVGNQLCLSEPLEIHAWPERNRITFEYDVVAVAIVMGTIIVLTEGYPYRVDGGFPETVSWSRIDALFPCVSKRSTVAMDYGVVYASHSGLVMYSPNTGIHTITKLIHDWDTWDNDIDYETIVAGSYQNRYIASYRTGSFIYERSGEEGVYVDIPTGFDAIWEDKLTNTAYIISKNSQTIYEWDNNSYPFSKMKWKSKVFILPDYANLGAARVIADYGSTVFGDSIDDYNDDVLELNQIIIDEFNALGYDPEINASLGGYNSFMFGGDVDGVTGVAIGISDNGVITPPSAMFAGDSYLGFFYQAGTGGLTTEVLFRLYANKELVFETILTDDSIFRLPTGYRTDTYEVYVEGAVRVRAIHLAETPIGLKQI